MCGPAISMLISCYYYVVDTAPIFIYVSTCLCFMCAGGGEDILLNETNINVKV